MTASRVIQNFVDGKLVDSADGRRADLIDPSTGEVFGSTPVSGAEDVDRAFAAAATAFETWRDTTPSERQRALLRFADALEARADDLVAAESQNTGKPIELTKSEEIPPMIDQVRFFAGAARLLEGRSAGEYMSGFTSYVRREPVGVVGQVAPWNYPMMMAIWKLAPAIAAGNTVVLKPSDTTPVSTVMMAEIAAEFLPAGVLNVICGDRDTGRALISHKTPAMVSITGSTRAGLEVAATAAQDLKRVHLELGGKAPVIVFDDADIANAGREHRDRRVLQRRAGLHGGHPRPRCAGGCRRLRRRAGRAGAGYAHRPTVRHRGAVRPAQQREPARPRRRHARPAARPRTRPRRWRA